jgi:hypothetical protein
MEIRLETIVPPLPDEFLISRNALSSSSRTVLRLTSVKVTRPSQIMPQHIRNSQKLGSI